MAAFAMASSVGWSRTRSTPSLAVNSRSLEVVIGSRCRFRTDRWIEMPLSTVFSWGRMTLTVPVESRVGPETLFKPLAHAA